MIENKYIQVICGKSIVIIMPIILVLIAGRILFFSPIMKWEYKKSSFPPDPYGFSLEDRLQYGPMFLDFLYHGKDICCLSKLTSSDGKKIFNKRELKHMEDVKSVIKKIDLMRAFVFIIFAFLLLILMRTGNFKILLSNLFKGGVFTIFLIFLFAVLGALSFGKLFNYFHELLGFTEGTWNFYESDALIRLFPLKFWFDMFILLVSIVFFVSGFISLVSWKILKLGYK